MNKTQFNNKLMECCEYMLTEKKINSDMIVLKHKKKKLLIFLEVRSFLET